MLPNWTYTMVAIMISINVLLIGFGLVTIDDSPLAKAEMVTVTTTIDDYAEGQNINPNVDTNTDASVSAGTDTSSSFGIKELINNAKRLILMISNLLFGFNIIFVLIGAPPLIIWLFSSIIGLIVMLVLVEIGMQVISAIRGLIIR